MYLAMGRVADREGYPEIGAAYDKIAGEEALHAAKICRTSRRSSRTMYKIKFNC